MSSIDDRQVVSRIHKLAKLLGLTNEAVLKLAVEERRSRFQDDFRDRMQRIDERWEAVGKPGVHTSMMEFDDLMYDDWGLPQ